jgi:ATP-dependent RNA helicase DDX3X
MSETNLDEVAEVITALSEAALSEAGTEKPKPAQNFVGAPTDAAEAETKAREYNWPQKVHYDYTTYAPKEEGALAVSGANLPTWACSAAKYEWLDEYGDVAPRIPELEAQLFDLEFLHGAGTWIENLKMEVKSEGAVNIEPIVKVRFHINSIKKLADFVLSSPRLVSILSCWRLCN